MNQVNSSKMVLEGKCLFICSCCTVLPCCLSCALKDRVALALQKVKDTLILLRFLHRCPKHLGESLCQQEVLTFKRSCLSLITRPYLVSHFFIILHNPGWGNSHAQKSRRIIGMHREATRKTAENGKALEDRYTHAKISQQIIVSKTQGTGTFLCVVRKSHTNWQVNSQRNMAERVNMANGLMQACPWILMEISHYQTMNQAKICLSI